MKTTHQHASVYTQALTMKRVLGLLEMIYASAVAHEIQNLCHEICCGCKIYTQDCLMMTEEEGWNTHGLAAMERVNSSPLVWHKFLGVLGVLGQFYTSYFSCAELNNNSVNSTLLILHGT